VYSQYWMKGVKFSHSFLFFSFPFRFASTATPTVASAARIASAGLRGPPSTRLGSCSGAMKASWAATFRCTSSWSIS
jgi:hypothetical protein